MAPQRKNMTVLNMRDTYHELGTFEFKVVLNSRVFKNCHGATVSISDSDGKPIKAAFRPWGTKLNCEFTIDNSVSDGIAAVVVSLPNGKGLVREMFQFWVIK